MTGVQTCALPIYPDSFRAKLRDGGFYREWQERFGAEAWGLLEGAVGKLA